MLGKVASATRYNLTSRQLSALLLQVYETRDAHSYKYHDSHEIFRLSESKWISKKVSKFIEIL